MYLWVLQSSRGWDTARFKTLEAGLACVVTQDSRRAYTIDMLQSISRDDVDFVKARIAQGAHPNTCNAFGQTVSTP